MNLVIVLIAASMMGAFVLASVFSPIMKKLAPTLGMLDHPVGHKAHAGAMPLLGGRAVILALVIPAALSLVLPQLWQDGSGPGWMPRALAIHLPGAASQVGRGYIILAGAFALHLMGLVDDRKALGPWIKLAVQLAASAAVVIFADVRVLTVAGATISIIVSIAWLVTIINAFNFMDNMDGLSAGVGVICALLLLISSVCMGQVFVSVWLALLVGALLGFLPYNFPPAKMYLGDGGSLVLGYILAVMTCLTTYTSGNGGQYLYGVFVPLVLLAVPLYDTTSVILLRLWVGSNPMVGDRRHFSHRLLRRGMSVRKAVFTIYLCTATTGIGAVLLPQVSNFFGATLVFIQTLAVLSLIALLESSGEE